MKNINMKAFGEPDVSLSGLKIWISGRQDDESTDFWDANRLVVTVQCTSNCSEIITQGPVIHLSEIEQWLFELQKLHQTIRGEAGLSCMEPGLDINVILGQSGSGSLVASITSDHMNERHDVTFSFDQSYLPSLIKELKTILKEYPIRGTRPKSSPDDLLVCDTPEVQGDGREEEAIPEFSDGSELFDAAVKLDVDGCYGDRICIAVDLSDPNDPDRPSKLIYEEIMSQLEGTPNYGRDNEAESFERPLSQDEVVRLASMVSVFQVPAFPVFALGCDGYVVTLEIRRGSNASRYSWWVSPPPGWEPLDRIAQTILQIAGVHEKAFNKVIAGP